MKLTSIKIPRKRGIRRRILVQREEKVSKCVVIGSSNSSSPKFIKSFQNCSESYLSHSGNEASFKIDKTSFILWGTQTQTPRLKKSRLKQYLAYHGSEVLFYLINDADIEVRIHT